MNKTFIISEIKRTAQENGGVSLGVKRFQKETGITKSDWLKHWTKWSDAQLEAGFQANKLLEGYDESFLLQKFIELILEIRKFPSSDELRHKHYSDKGFPSRNTFTSRFGKKHEIASKIVEYCEATDDFPEAKQICQPFCRSTKGPSDRQLIDPVEPFGFVYLMKSGKYYKLGHSRDVGKRRYDIGLKQPEKTTIAHKIQTDDPKGIEDYWKKRFEAKRKGGEWFDLDAIDVKAFKRRKFM